MEVYVLSDEPLGNGGNILGVYKDPLFARKAFDIYIDALESEWRKQDGQIDEHNTFNRFCEPQDNIILSASCDVATVIVRKFTLE